MLKTFSKSIAFAAIFSLALFPFTSMAQSQESQNKMLPIDTQAQVQFHSAQNLTKPEINTYDFCFFDGSVWSCY